ARHLEMKEVVMDEVDTDIAYDRLSALASSAADYLASTPKKIGFVRYWLYGYPRTRLRDLATQMEGTVEYLANSRSNMVINKLMDYPILRSLWLYHPTNYAPLAWCAIVVFPLSFPIYLVGRNQLRKLRAEIETIEKVSIQLQTLISES
ncbi:MAG: hypothetical protein K2J17_03350, partial [Paramuribaculum sp.]|nr:hypothetical protein [Paramuribaculum sp.]